ncbi:hypothetical protein CCHR01_09917 [Colletotrichum chrysophilum]|uniref:Uncharacterized protein n=1 Tax=Colletotrichum chrysophilum TaxID=1836956 RepID=A0AAD9EGA2_9PEZI|nr:hypothetical protein CCHR01_09917 [Colletotrichum chrysophilum]
MVMLQRRSSYQYFQSPPAALPRPFPNSACEEEPAIFEVEDPVYPDRRALPHSHDVSRPQASHASRPGHLPLYSDCSGCWHVVLSDVSREEGWSRFAGLEASLGSLILTF